MNCLTIGQQIGLRWPVLCSEHGKAGSCYVQPDGTHIDTDACICVGYVNPDCPVKEHADRARRTKVAADSSH